MKTKYRIWDETKQTYHFVESDLGDLFTGSKDVNGNDIYVGDKIVCYFQKDGDHWNHMTGKSTGTVKFDKNLSQFRVFFKGRNGRMDNMSLEKHHDHVVISK